MKRRHHWETRAEGFVHAALETLPAWATAVFAVGSAPWIERIFRRVLGWAFLSGLIQGVAVVDPEKYRNRELIFFREARQRGLDVVALEWLGTPTRFFAWRWQGKTLLFERNPLDLFAGPRVIADKIATKRLLAAEGIPVAEGALFDQPSKALAFAASLGAPVVVKPNNGSLSQHVTVGASSPETVAEAIRIAQLFSPAFVVEAFVPGTLYRATVIGRELVFVCEKRPATVEGDGVQTLRTLIEQKNADPRRGVPEDRTSTLHRVPMDARLETYLATQGLALDMVPACGQRCQIQEKAILSQGCDILACTASAHPENRKLFLRIAEVMQGDLLGIDIIMEDVTRPWQEQRCAVLETNSLPYVDMHEVPSEGEPDRVAELAWDWVLARKNAEQAARRGA